MSETLKPARRMHLAAVLTLLMVFAAGALVGAALERHHHGGPPRGAIPRGGGPPPMFAEHSRIAERLKLTPDQRDSIERITAHDRAHADSVFHHTRGEMRAHLDSTMRAVEAVLTPAQRAEWRRIHQEMREREGPEGPIHRRSPGGPGGHGPGRPPHGPP
jgi:Spy/CpxP family protein refolding chaperone